jgi:hypothetical protein
MSSTDDDPTTEEILTALKTIGITGSLDSIRQRRTEGTSEEGPSARWAFWVKNKVCLHDDSPAARTTSTTPTTK